MVDTAANVAAANRFLSTHPGVRWVDLLLADLHGVLRGKRVARDEFAAVCARGLYLPGSMFALDVLGETIESTGLGFDDGDADRACLPVPDSLVPVPWLGADLAQQQVQMHELDGRPFFGDPRQVLAGVVERFRADGLTPVVAIELEFYLVDRERDAGGQLQPPLCARTGRRERHTQINSMVEVASATAILRDIADACAAQDVPAGSALAECGPSQWEVNLHHVADAAHACDHAVRLKRIVKGIAECHGLIASFMAKPYRDAAGSGTHVHVSLQDDAGRNVFAAEEPFANPRLRHAVAGLLATLPDGMAVFAPNANSYRRLRPQSYVPMHATWGHNNRGVAVRVPPSAAVDRRIEHRVAGADVNPYLLTAVVLAGMHVGLSLAQEPGAPFSGNAYQAKADAASLPVHWPVALQHFRRSAVLREYLGSRFVDLYAEVKASELAAFESHVTPLEFDWLLTRV
jgi:glutamine synthetase